VNAIVCEPTRSYYVRGLSAFSFEHEKKEQAGARERESITIRSAASRIIQRD